MANTQPELTQAQILEKIFGKKEAYDSASDEAAGNTDRDFVRGGVYVMTLEGIFFGLQRNNNNQPYCCIELTVDHVLLSRSGTDKDGEAWVSNAPKSAVKIWEGLDRTMDGFTTKGAHGFRRIKNVLAAIMSAKLGVDISAKQLDFDKFMTICKEENQAQFAGTPFVLDRCKSGKYFDTNAWTQESDHHKRKLEAWGVDAKGESVSPF